MLGSLAFSALHLAKAYAIPQNYLSVIKGWFAHNTDGYTPVSAKSHMVDAIDFTFLDGSSGKAEISESLSFLALGRDRGVVYADKFIVGLENRHALKLIASGTAVIQSLISPSMMFSPLL
ncbi:MAG: hypothetical protein H7A51_19245 [Akkermansiaceae bacterium]|nr:hypothetical protein [Akkermansiaceae bacterium]